MDPVVGMMGRLDQALRQAELGTLAIDAMEVLIEGATDLVDPVLEQAMRQAVIGDFGTASQAWTNLADLSDRLVSLMRLYVDQMLADTPAGELVEGEVVDSEATDRRYAGEDPDYEEPGDELDGDELAEVIDGVVRMGTLARGQAFLYTAINRRLWGSPADAEAAAAEAKRIFESIPEGGSADINAPVLVALADSQRLVAIASAEQLRFKYEDSAVTYLQAKKALERARARLLEADEIEAMALASITADIYECTMAAERALLMKSIGDGDFEKAVGHADAMVRTAPPPDNAQLPPFIRASATMLQCNAGAYLAYTQAEVAANGRNWDEALRKLGEADRQWRELVAISIDLDIPQARQVADTAQALSSQMTGTCRRRIVRERSLYAEIAEVQTQNQQLQAKIFELAGKTTQTFQGGYKNMSGDEFNIEKVGQAGSIGSHNTNSGFTMNQTNVENPLANVDMRALAEQLESLVDKLKASAWTADQQTALAEVSEAAQAARGEDKPGTLQHLKKAGQWALSVATNIGVPLAVAALKAALGLPAM